MAADMSVEVQGDDIVVTLPGTSYVVTYYRAAAFPQQLLTKSHSGREDEDAPITQAEFHARAWKAASHKARALGGLYKRDAGRSPRNIAPVWPQLLPSHGVGLVSKVDAAVLLGLVLGHSMSPAAV